MVGRVLAKDELGVRFSLAAPLRFRHKAPQASLVQAQKEKDLSFRSFSFNIHKIGDINLIQFCYNDFIV